MEEPKSIFEEKPLICNGEIYSKYTISPYGKITNSNTDRTLKPREMKNSHGEHLQGYMIVDVYDDSGVKHTRLLHRLVAEAYIDNPDNLETINHKNGDKHRNYYSNLEWASYRDNNLHSIETGLAKRANCENHQNATLTNDIVHNICKLLEQGYLYQDIVSELNLGHIENIISKIKMIKTGNSWKSISSQYKLSSYKNMKHINSEQDIRNICSYLEEFGFTSNDDIIEYCNLINNKQTRALIYRIRTRKRYTNISKDYNF